MNRIVMIAGAGDAAGLRMTRDFLKRGDTVIAGLLTGQETAEIPEGVTTVPIDPLSQPSAKSAAAAVAANFPHIDLLVVNYDCCTEPSGWTILDTPDYAALQAAYDYNTLGPLRAIDAFLPLLSAGEGRRICCVTTADSSNNLTRGVDNYPAHVSTAPLNMAMNQLFNGLRPEGYTFRMYCKDPDAAPDKAGEYAVEYFTRNRSNEPESYKHSDENRLVLRDWMNIEIPW